MRLFYLLFIFILCFANGARAESLNEAPMAVAEDAQKPSQAGEVAGTPASSGASASSVASVDSAASTDKSAEQSFNIFEYQVDGNTVLPFSAIEKAVYPFLGEQKTVEDVEKARAALEKAFHSAGYLTVFVNTPEQEVTGGLVKLEVQEGKVERLKVVGAKYYSLGRIKTKVAEFQEGNVPYFPKVQKQIASVNINADRKVAPVLRPGKTPGKVEVELKVDDQLPFHGGIELNNRYSPNTTKTRLNGSMRYDNLWQRDHSVSLSFQVTPEDTTETKVLSATYVIPDDGDYWAGYAVISKSDVSAVGDVNVIGDGNIFGLRYIHPLPAAMDDYYHNLTVGVDYKDFKENTTVQGADSFATPISYMPFLLGYNGTYNTPLTTTKVDLNFTFSVRGLLNDEQEFADKRFLARPNFSYLRYNLDHTYRFYKQWELLASIGGQVTGDSIISNEQFAIGGLNTVRGYLESNALGDMGVNSSLELRTPPLQKYFPDAVQSIYALAFYDYGFAKVRDALPRQIDRFHLASTGFGFYVKGRNGVFAELDYAYVMRSALPLQDGYDRLLFRIGYDW